MWYDVKRTGAVLLATINLVLLVWALVAYRRRSSLPDNYYKLLLASPVVAAFQMAMGVTLLAKGFQPPGMHVFYGILVGTGAATQLTLRPRTAAGHKYRARPLVHLVLALFVMLLSLRSWMAA